jgi:hypothetical protein
MVTGLIVAAAATTAVSMQRQAEAGRRAETRAKAIAAEEGQRQRKQEKLIATQEKIKSQRVGARLKATAGRRAGRRSLISGSETGVSELGQQQQLG